MSRFLSVLVAELRITFRNRQRIVIGFLSPVVLMVLIGLAFGKGQPLSLPIGVVDQDGSTLSRALVDTLGQYKDNGILLYTGDRGGEIQKLKDGDRRLVIVIPPGFGALTLGFETSLDVYEDPSDPQNAKLAMTVMQSALVELQSRTGITAGLSVDRHAVGGGRRLSYLDFLAPGLLGMGAMNIALMGAISSFVQYRERGILRRIRVTPLPIWTFVAGSSAVSLLLALIQVFLLLGVAIVVFNVRIVGSWAALLAIVLIGNAAFVCLGIIISSVANTFQSAQVIATATILPMIFLSGTFFQAEAMPRFLQPLIKIMPLTHLVSALRTVALRGGTIATVSPQLLVLLGLGGALFLLATRLFRWE